MNYSRNMSIYCDRYLDSKVMSKIMITIILSHFNNLRRSIGDPLFPKQNYLQPLNKRQTDSMNNKNSYKLKLYLIQHELIILMYYNLPEGIRRALISFLPSASL